MYRQVWLIRGNETHGEGDNWHGAPAEKKTAEFGTEWSRAQRSGWIRKFDFWKKKKIRKNFVFWVTVKVLHRLHQQNKLKGILEKNK